jgi:dGTPase
MQPNAYVNRAPYAANPSLTRGRLIPEPSSPTRTDFQRDRDRIIHSAAFRRLAHKTQLALAHDLGHTPFGHTGEDALEAAMADFGGFDHNAQALRIVTRLERRYADFDGLNLTWETLEGLVKHNGPVLRTNGRPVDRYAARGVPLAILEYDRTHPLARYR